MKTQILQKGPTEPFLILNKDSCLSNEKYYGITNGYRKGIIGRAEYQTGPYLLQCLESVTKGNNWPNRAKNPDDLRSTIEYSLDIKLEVFVFDTWEELLGWLSE